MADNTFCHPGLPSHPKHELAVSLGDAATLVKHSVSMTHASIPADRRRAAGIRDGLLRMSVGLERPEDLPQDIDRALGSH